MNTRMIVLLVAVSSLLSACAGRVQRPVQRAPGPPAPPASDSAAFRQCIGRLDRNVARYALLPDRTFGGGCSALGAVQLRDIGTPVTNLGSMTCGLADAFTLWVQQDVQPIARREFGVAVQRVESMGTYSCRNVNGASTGKLSEHAHANAVDVNAFVLEDGRRFTVSANWNGGSDGARFLRDVRASACRRFVTVLSPDYNALHHDHLHFDMGGRPFCR